MNYKNTLILSTLVVSASVVGFAALCRYVKDKELQEQAALKRAEERTKDGQVIADLLDLNAELIKSIDGVLSDDTSSDNILFANVPTDVCAHMGEKFKDRSYKFIFIPHTDDMGNGTGYFDGLCKMDLSSHIPKDLPANTRPVFIGKDFKSNRVFIALYDCNEERNIVFFQRYGDNTEIWIRQCTTCTSIGSYTAMIELLSKNIAIV